MLHYLISDLTNCTSVIIYVFSNLVITLMAIVAVPLISILLIDLQETQG